MVLKRFDELQEGDLIRGVDGDSVRVTKAYDVHLPATMYEVESTDGEVLKVSGNHLWYVVTQLDLELHRSRLREAKQVLKKWITDDVERALLELIAHEEELETHLVDIMTLLGSEDDSELYSVVLRIADSLGPIGEVTTVAQDMVTGEQAEGIMLRSYHMQPFAQQLLALTGKRAHRREWPVIKGRVITTEEMLDSYETMEIPVAKAM